VHDAAKATVATADGRLAARGAAGHHLLTRAQPRLSASASPEVLALAGLVTRVRPCSLGLPLTRRRGAGPM